MHDRLKKQSEVHVEPLYHHHDQNCATPSDNIVCTSRVKAVADYQPQEHGHEGQVSLLDGSLRLMYLVSSLSINGQVLGNPPLGGLSQR